MGLKETVGPGWGSPSNGPDGLPVENKKKASPESKRDVPVNVIIDPQQMSEIAAVVAEEIAKQINERAWGQAAKKISETPEETEIAFSLLAFEWRTYAGSDLYWGTDCGYTSLDGVSLMDVEGRGSVCYDPINESIMIYGTNIPPNVSLCSKVLIAGMVKSSDNHGRKLSIGRLERKEFLKILKWWSNHHTEHCHCLVEGYTEKYL